MQSFKTIVQIQKFSKNVGIHFAVGKCKGERKKYRLCLMLFRDSGSKYLQLRKSGKTYSACQEREKSRLAKIFHLGGQQHDASILIG